MTRCRVIVGAVVVALINSAPVNAQDADALETYRLQPICLRTATVGELTAIPGFSARVASAVLRIVTAVPQSTIHTIADTLCLSLPQRLMLLSCATLDCRPGIVSSIIGSTRSGSRLDAPRGVRDGVWAGAASDDVQRIDLRHGPHRLVAVRASASGEAASDAWFGVTADVQPVPTLRTVVGNVAPAYGCGLIMGSAAATRGPWTVALDRNDAGATVRPWTSSQRFGYLRGAAMDLRVGTHLRVLPLVGLNNLRGSIDTDDEGTYVRSIDRLAFQRTPLERARTPLRETVVGLVSEWDTNDYLWGFALWHWTYTAPLRTSAAWALTGTGGLAMSAHGHAPLHGILRWEVARSPTSDVALALQWWQQPSPIRWMAAARWIGPNYRSPYGASFTDASSVANEMGLTAGFTYRRFGWHVDAVTDVRRTLTRTYTVPGIVRGITTDVQMMKAIRGGHSVGARLLYEGETDGVRGIDSTRTVAVHRQRLRCRSNAAMRLAVPLIVTARLDLAGAWWESVHESAAGSALSVGLRYRGAWWWVGAQWTAFRATDIDAAVYVGEVAVPGTFRSVALTGRGQRVMVQARATIGSWCDVAVAYVHHRRSDVATLGNGWEALTGPVDRRLHVQTSLRWKSQAGPVYEERHNVDDESATWLE